MISVRVRAGLMLCMSALMVVGLAACGAASGTGAAAIAGDAQRGAAIFTTSIDGAPPCNSCHSLDGSEYGGPTLKGVAAVAGTRVNGQSAAAYIEQSIRQPSAYIVSGYGNVMYSQYANHLSAQQIADLVAYILTLN